MDWFLEQCQFERKQRDESTDEEDVFLQPGYDIDKIGEREVDGSRQITYEVNKDSPIFEVEMRWVFEPGEEEFENDEILESSVNRIIQWEGSHHLTNYLISMNLPPIPGLLELPPEDEDEDESDEPDV